VWQNFFKFSFFLSFFLSFFIQVFPFVLSGPAVKVMHDGKAMAVWPQDWFFSFLCVHRQSENMT